MNDCVFCKISSFQEPAKIIRQWDDAIAIVPLNPVVDGHIIVIPKAHVADALECPDITAEVMRYVCLIAERPCNIITSVGSEATQSVFHLHIHIIPRKTGDDLPLPWNRC